jgi:hypothetical protein
MSTLVGVPFQRYEIPAGTFNADADGLITAAGPAIIQLLQAGCDFAPPGPTVQAHAESAAKRE